MRSDDHTLRGEFAAVPAIALSIEVPLVFGSQDPHPFCDHEDFFKTQLAGSKSPVRRTLHHGRATPNCRFTPGSGHFVAPHEPPLRATSGSGIWIAFGVN